MHTSETAKNHFNEGLRYALDAADSASQGKTDEASYLFEKSIIFYNRALDLDPTQATFMSAKGFALSQLGKIEEAFALFEAAIEMEPHAPENHYQLSLCLFEYGMIDDGIATFNVAHKLSTASTNLPSRLCSDITSISQKFSFYARDCLALKQPAAFKDISTKTVALTAFGLSLNPNHASLKQIHDELAAELRLINL